MEETQAARTPQFLDGLDDPSFVRAVPRAGRLGSTTHIAVLDADGRACSVTCSDGSCSGVIVPGTGVHLNNMLGEQDLNPLGFHRFPPGRRLPSMMAPTVVLRDGDPELVLGSAGSNRIRSAILQTIIRVVDDGLRAGGRRQGAATALRGRDRLRRARSRCRGARGGPGSTIAASATSTCSSAASRPRSAIRAAGSRAAATPGVAETRSWCNQPREEIDFSSSHCSPLAILLAGCGFDIQEPDLFLLTRTGAGQDADAARQRLRHDQLQRRQDQDAARPAADPGARSRSEPRQRRHGQAQDRAYAETASTSTRSSCRTARSSSPTRPARRSRPRPGGTVRGPDRSAGLRIIRVGSSDPDRALCMRKDSRTGGLA